MPEIILSGSAADIFWFENTYLQQLNPYSRIHSLASMGVLYGNGGKLTISFNDARYLAGGASGAVDASGKFKGDVDIRIDRDPSQLGQPNFLQAIEGMVSHEIIHILVGPHSWGNTKTPPTAQQIVGDAVYQKVMQENYARGVYFLDENGNFTSPSALDSDGTAITLTEYMERYAKVYEAAYASLPNGPYLGAGIPRDDPQWALFSPAFGAGLGSTVGSSLGNYLAAHNRTLGVLYSCLRGEAFERVGLALAGASGRNVPNVEDALKSTFGADVVARMKQAGIGAISSMLAAELGNALGLDGFGAELTGTVNGTVIGKIIGNLTATNATAANMWDGFSSNEIFKPGGAGFAMANACLLYTSPSPRDS